MIKISWNHVKSSRLKRTRGVSFDDIIAAELVEVLNHPKRPDQKVMLFKYRGYIWVVPFVQNEKEIFLKTLYPSRKYTKIYSKKERP